MTRPTWALIFDFDGLIVDTEAAIFEAWQELYRSQGEELELADYVNCVGSTFGQFDPMRELERRLGYEPDWPVLLAAKDRRIREGHVGLPPLPGVRELLQEAKEAGVPCAIASSSEITWVGRWLQELHLAPYFQAVWTRDRVARAKPAPDLFLGAADELGLEPSVCLVLEDSRNGLLAAEAAGCPCVIVPSTVTRGLDFTGAQAVLPTLAGVGVNDLAQWVSGVAQEPSSPMAAS